ncbi:MAG: hypothetical protein WD826_03465, partial [Actinomycetota bacterium]
ERGIGAGGIAQHLSCRGEIADGLLVLAMGVHDRRQVGVLFPELAELGRIRRHGRVGKLLLDLGEAALHCGKSLEHDGIPSESSSGGEHRNRAGGSDALSRQEERRAGRSELACVRLYGSCGAV